MIEVPGEVVAVEQGRALVRTRSGGGGCGRCHESGGCGGARIGSMFRPEQADFWLDNPIQADVGDQVLVCLAEEVSAYRDFWRAPPTDAMYFHRKLGGMFLLASRVKARVDVNGLVRRWLP